VEVSIKCDTSLILGLLILELEVSVLLSAEVSVGQFGTDAGVCKAYEIRRTAPTAFKICSSLCNFKINYVRSDLWTLISDLSISDAYYCIVLHLQSLNFVVLLVGYSMCQPRGLHVNCGQGAT